MELCTRKQLWVVACVYLGKFVKGYGLLWLVPMLFKESFYEVISFQFMIITMFSTFIGLITGPFVTGFLANIKGRKPCFFIGGSSLLIAFVLKAASEWHWTVLHVSRGLYGFGTGIVSVTSLVYVGEIASTKNRGKFLTGLDVFHLIGIIIVVSIGPWVPYYIVCCIGILLCLCFLVGVYFIPESPLYLMMKGNEESIKKSLTALGRADDINNALSTKLEQLAVIKRKRDYWLDIFKVKGNRRAFFITLVLVILQQAIGIIALIYIVQSVLVFSVLPMTFTYMAMAVSVIQVIAGGLSPFLVEYFGRKTMLTISTASCGLCLALMGTFNFVHLFVKATVWAAIMLLIIFINLIMSYELGFGKIPQTLIGEMFTPYVRSSGTALILSTNFIVTYIFSFTITYLIEIDSNIPFWIYSVTCAGACAVTIFVVPETMGRSLVEIQDMMSKKGLIHKP